ncbi:MULTISPECIES: hypothetical protein [Actinomyces]|uniref:Uncharacterized protein n=1 Tax=Actinomyces respiraculi TaxID=2744574 RepID=A0A7T0LJQ4_9ACTO|nr:MULTISPECIES: hypothetical protein [Actinomyces]QPL05029.1 hypothetical protein ID810_09815 [Actinomyces respiraculi]
MILTSAVAVGLPAPVGYLEVPDVDAAVAAVESVPGDALLVVGADVAARPALMAREVVARPDVALVTLDGPRTRKALLLRALTHLPPESYGMADYVVRAINRQCNTRKALSSVTSLVSPKPTLRQHLRSLFPKPSFDIDLEADTIIFREGIQWDLGDSLDVVWASSSEMGHLSVGLGVRVPPVVLPSDSGRLDGARYWAEVSWHPDVARAVRTAIGTVLRTSCRACGRATAPTGCPFCGIVLSPRVFAPAPRTERIAL